MRCRCAVCALPRSPVSHRGGGPGAGRVLRERVEEGVVRRQCRATTNCGVLHLPRALRLAPLRPRSRHCAVQPHRMQVLCPATAGREQCTAHHMPHVPAVTSLNADLSKKKKIEDESIALWANTHTLGHNTIARSSGPPFTHRWALRASCTIHPDPCKRLCPLLWEKTEDNPPMVASLVPLDIALIIVASDQISTRPVSEVSIFG